MKHHIMNILKVYGRSLKRNNIIVIISFSTHLAFNICICYNVSRQYRYHIMSDNVEHKNENLRAASLRFSCSFTGNRAEANCHLYHYLTI